MGEIRILNQNGDETLDWNAGDAKSVDAARARFDELKERGYNFYESVTSRGKQVIEFDPKAGKLIAAPGAASKTDKQTGARPAAMRGGPLAATRALR